MSRDIHDGHSFPQNDNYTVLGLYLRKLESLECLTFSIICVANTSCVKILQRFEVILLLANRNVVLTLKAIE